MVIRTEFSGGPPMDEGDEPTRSPAPTLETLGERVADFVAARDWARFHSPKNLAMALSVEAPEGAEEAIYQHEPKLRDSFLQVLFDHANTGGFDGAFTDPGMLRQLRDGLREIAQRDLDPEMVRDVLITELARQDY